jgi:hypothetical protein
MSRDLVLMPDALSGRSLTDMRTATRALGESLTRPAGSAGLAALKRICDAYPAPDLVNPRAAVADMAAAIEDYPALVVEDLADPKIGIVRQSRFVPRIAELVAWCERRSGEYRAAYDQPRAFSDAAAATIRALVLGLDGPPVESEMVSHSPRPGPDRAPLMTQAEIARSQGFTGDGCDGCGQFAMKRGGTCLTCQACGTTTGCG